MLTALGAKTDCVIVHYYPGGSSTAGMLTDPDDIPGVISTLQLADQPVRQGGPGRA